MKKLMIKSRNARNNISKYCFIILFSQLFQGCSSTPSAQNNEQGLADPLASINRPIWQFNWHYADKYVLKPVTKSYVYIMPKSLRKGLYNAALNLNEPSTIINNILQAKFVDAATSAGRFVVNSTVGLLGFFDLADNIGWERSQEEFGEVLAQYGVGDGPFLMMPMLGPSSVREEVGDYVDRYYWPLAAIDFWPNVLSATIIGLEARAALFNQETLISESLDSYEFIKNAYYQNLQFKVYDGHPPTVVHEDEFDEDEFDELDNDD